MTTNAPNWNTTQYANRAMHIHQQKGNRLRPTISTAGRIENNKTAVFWLAGTSKAVKRTRNQRNIPSNADFNVKSTEPFDLNYMNKLYELGYQEALSGNV